jgi:hypothetical protein
MESTFKYEPIEIKNKNLLNFSDITKIARLAYPNLVAGTFKEFSIKVNFPQGVSKDDFQGT